MARRLARRRPGATLCEGRRPDAPARLTVAVVLWCAAGQLAEPADAGAPRGAAERGAEDREAPAAADKLAGKALPGSPPGIPGRDRSGLFGGGDYGHHLGTYGDFDLGGSWHGYGRDGPGPLGGYGLGGYYGDYGWGDPVSNQPC